MSQVGEEKAIFDLWDTCEGNTSEDCLLWASEIPSIPIDMESLGANEITKVTLKAIHSHGGLLKA